MYSIRNFASDLNYIQICIFIENVICVRSKYEVYIYGSWNNLECVWFTDDLVSLEQFQKWGQNEW
jgi:hypothetical protein